MTEAFYDDAYFARFLDGGAANHKFYFEDFVAPDTVVADFGCAGGWLLAAINCAKRIGVEINPRGREFAKRQFGLDVYPDLESLSSGSADVVISNHALEHVIDPPRILRETLRVLKPRGRAVFVVPSESVLSGFKANDPDQHLYTWSPANLGNLFQACGFKVIECKPLVYRWPPKPDLVRKLFGPRGFHLLGRLWGMIYLKMSQVRIVAEKP